MRITYRTRGAKDYWTARWSKIPADSAMDNLEAYPLKYAERTITNPDGSILEAGCGVGRILRYYHEKGYDILGFDYVDVAIEKLKKADPSLKVEVADVTNLHYEDKTFSYVLAFGLFHNLEHGLDQAVAETFRVLEYNGKVCASFRADNIQTKLTDWLAERNDTSPKSEKRHFHKMNLRRREFEELFTRAGFVVEDTFPVENMPILYKFRFFRSSGHKDFNENIARREGYQLSWYGKALQKLLMRFFPDQFCNIYVVIARKP